MPLVQHPLYLVLAALVAVLGSWTALDLFLRVRVWVGQPRYAWLTAASVAMGLSLWAMHFIAGLSFDVVSAVRYDGPLTALSLALAIGATGFAFAIAGNGRPSPGLIAFAGAVMGVGVAGMHYVGMAALRSASAFAYRPSIVALTFAVAIAASTGALVAVGRSASSRRRAATALAVGVAMTGVHYCALASVRLLPAIVGGAGGVEPLVLAPAVASATLVVLFLAFVATLFDRRFEGIAAVEAKRSEAQLRAILDQMPVGVVVCDAPSGVTRFINPEAEHLVQPLSREPPWQWAGAHALLDENGQPRPPESFALYRAIRRGQRTQSERTTFLRDDGYEIVLEQTAAPVLDRDGRIVQGVLTFQDVTAKVKAEQALLRSQRMEGIGQLTGGVAHDFNNLLTAILGNLDLAARRVEDDRTRQLIDNAVQAARRGARLTGQLLAFSRRQRLETQPIDINSAIEHMGGLFASTLGGTVTVTAELQPNLPAALADPAQLELALLNLALNARDAMPQGGQLRLSTSLATLGHPSADSEPEAGRYLAITVADTGRGMLPETVARAFEPFFTTKTEGKGSGLGLSQVLGLAKQLGGGVRLTTAPGEGCAVCIFLPVSALAAEGSAPETQFAARQAAVAGAAVLVVDDDEDVRNFVAALLRESGCTVRTEGDGASGLKAVAEESFDLVVLDFAMPGMTGAEVARLMRERQDATPVLIMTGYLEHEAVLAQLGAQPILQKPFEPDELLTRLAALVRRRTNA